MKLVPLLAAGLSLSCALTIPSESSTEKGLGRRAEPQPKALVQRVAPEEGGSRGGDDVEPDDIPPPNPDDVLPGLKQNPEDTTEFQEFIQQLRETPGYESGWNYKLDSQPKAGEDVTGVWVDQDNKIIHLYYGSLVEQHRKNVMLQQAANGEDPANPRIYKKASSSAKDAQRKDAQKGAIKIAGTILDEKPQASLYHPGAVTTDVQAPIAESIRESIMTRYMANIQDQDSEWSAQTHDSLYTTPGAVGGDLNYAKGPPVKIGDIEYNPQLDTSEDGGQIVVPQPGPASAGDDGGRIYDLRKGQVGPGARQKRDLISQIQGGEGSSQDPTDQDLDQISAYLNCWSIAQANATDLLWPYIEAMINASDSQLVYDAAFSIYADLIHPGMSVRGPFYNGLHSFDWIEDQAEANGASPEEMQMLYAVDGVLIDMYMDAWVNGSAAANSTGLLGNLDTLAGYLTPVNTSLLPDGNITSESVSDANANFAYFNAPANRFVNLSTIYNLTDSGNSTQAGNLTRRAAAPVRLY